MSSGRRQSAGQASPSANSAGAASAPLPHGTRLRLYMCICALEVVAVCVDRLLRQQDTMPLLPLYFSDGAQAPPNWDRVLLDYQSAVHHLVRHCVNCAAAMEVNGFIAGTVAYPILVLLHATASAEALPAVFFLDVVQGLLHSVLNKHAFVQLGRWESRSRYWTVGTASVGEGKSPCVKPLMQAMQRVLQKHAALAVGHASDNFHLHQRACRGQVEVQRIAALLERLQQLRLGILVTDSQNRPLLRKFRVECLHARTVGWLRTRRVPLHLFGVPPRASHADFLDPGFAAAPLQAHSSATPPAAEAADAAHSQARVYV